MCLTHSGCSSNAEFFAYPITSDLPDGAGALFTIPLLGSFADGQLSPNEAFTVAFQIGLQSFNPFQFVVDVLGEEIP